MQSGRRNVERNRTLVPSTTTSINQHKRQIHKTNTTRTEIMKRKEGRRNEISAYTIENLERTVIKKSGKRRI